MDPWICNTGFRWLRSAEYFSGALGNCRHRYNALKNGIKSKIKVFWKNGHKGHFAREQKNKNIYWSWKLIQHLQIALFSDISKHCDASLYGLRKCGSFDRSVQASVLCCLPHLQIIISSGAKVKLKGCNGHLTKAAYFCGSWEIAILNFYVDKRDWGTNKINTLKEYYLCQIKINDKSF